MKEVDFDAVGAWSFPLRIMVIIGVCGVLGIVGYLALLQGHQQQLHDAQQTQVSLRATFTQQQTDVARLPAYRAQQAALQTQLGQIINSKSSMADVLVDISQSGLAAGVTFELFQPQTAISHDWYVELPVKLRITGHYHALGAFVSSLANRSRIMTLHDMHIRPQHASGKTSEKSRLMLETTVKAYRDRPLDSQ